MNTTSKLTKGIHPSTNLRKIIGCRRLLINTSSQLTKTVHPKTPLFTQLSFIHSLKGESVCTCEHTMHISTITFMLTSIHALTYIYQITHFLCFT